MYNTLPTWTIIRSPITISSRKPFSSQSPPTSTVFKDLLPRRPIFSSRGECSADCTTQRSRGNATVLLPKWSRRDPLPRAIKGGSRPFAGSSGPCWSDGRSCVTSWLKDSTDRRILCHNVLWLNLWSSDGSISCGKWAAPYAVRCFLWSSTSGRLPQLPYEIWI